jgi:hypothetical protein
MADTSALRAIGLVYAFVTVMVTTIAAMMVIVERGAFSAEYSIVTVVHGRAVGR